MFEIIKSGGWLMVPIIACSILAATIIVVRLRALRRPLILPTELSNTVLRWIKADQMDAKHMEMLRESSPLGRVIAAGISKSQMSRDLMKESMENVARHEVHSMEKFLNALGTIAAITPLLGLLGTVVGMVDVFSAITQHGVGNPTVLAGGISEALITTAAGLGVAIPSLIAYRFLRRRIDSLVVDMEQEAVRMMDSVHGQRLLR